MRLQLTAFPGCCGAYILYGFGQTNVAGYGRGAADVGQITQELDFYIEKYAKCVGFFVATLNDRQRKVYGKILYDKGFRRKLIAYNPGHTSRIWLYTRDNHPEKVEELTESDGFYKERSPLEMPDDGEETEATPAYWHDEVYYEDENGLPIG